MNLARSNETRKQINLKHLLYISFVLILLALTSCSGTKGIAPNAKLFTGTKMTFKDPNNITNKGELNSKINTAKITPNSPGLLNIKTGFYNVYDSTGSKGFKHMIKYRIGSKPVIYDNNMMSITELRIRNAITDEGYLNASVKCDTIVKKRRISLGCTAIVGSRYVIDSFFYLNDTLPVVDVLKVLHQPEYIKAGAFYKVSDLTADRTALVSSANNNGFPYINAQDIVYFVDTIPGTSRLDVHMRLRESPDTLKYERYSYGGIYVNPNFTLNADSPTDTTSMITYGDLQIKSGYDFLRKSALNKAIFIKEGNIYNAKQSKQTTDRLLDFGLFKFVNVKTVMNPQTKRIDHFLNLTTYKMESISGELELNNRQGNFLGLAGKVSYSNKNIFGGAEQFDLSLSGGLETQFGDQQSFLNTSEIKLEGTVTMPRVVLPFINLRTNRNYIPKTTMSMSVSQVQRIEFYTARSASAKYGFKWNETDTKSSYFKPIDLSWVVLASTTPAFDSILINDARQRLSFQSTLIMGSSYDYVYNKRDKYNPANQVYFKGSIESAGNLLSLFLKPSSGQTQADLFGTPYAQFVRLTVDLRKYWSMPTGLIATRLLTGAGFAYGNSAELPYSRQYSIGGANSLRAFRLRTLGPGEYVSPQGSETQFLDQTGDIKIEASIEYRFPILEFFKGAFFVDAGNVWLYDTQETSRANGVFGFDTFANQIAVGTGVGIRFDIDIFVLRLDAAFPIRDLRNGKFEWVIDEIEPFSGSWHGKNMIFNLGIGYPF